MNWLFLSNSWCIRRESLPTPAKNAALCGGLWNALSNVYFYFIDNIQSKNRVQQSPPASTCIENKRHLITISCLSHFSKRRINEFGHIESHREHKEHHVNPGWVQDFDGFNIVLSTWGTWLLAAHDVSHAGWRWHSLEFVGQSSIWITERDWGNFVAIKMHRHAIHFGWISLVWRASKRSYLTFSVCSIWTSAWACGRHVPL